VTERFSFEAVDALDYDELRPSYAPEAVAWVADRGGIGPGSLVIDLAAGTGQLSRPFASLGIDVIAVEPASNMRAVLEEREPAIRIMDGTAESIPLGDASADAVVVGNAFHHFDRWAAFEEIRRVLRPKGSLALFWTWMLEEQFLRYPWMQEVDAVVEATRASSAIATAYRTWKEPPEASAGFSPFERREFPMTHTLASTRVADLYATSSDVASLPTARREAMLDRIRELSREQPPLLTLAGRSVVDLCFRSASSET
jgi:SAM-dependent methyltransferase